MNKGENITKQKATRLEFALRNLDNGWREGLDEVQKGKQLMKVYTKTLWDHVGPPIGGSPS